MAIVLPPGHPRASTAAAAAAAAGDDGDAAGEDRARLRIGVINIMPRLEAYEVALLEPLAEHAAVVEPVFVRLRSHGYGSSDHAHLDRFYQDFDRAVADAPLDGLIVTGAPVEELAFEDVHYFAELEQILAYARAYIPVTLGLCWGGMVLGQLCGVGKQMFRRKLFGVYEDRVLVANHDIVPGASFTCAHSRHAGLVEADVEIAARGGVIRPLSRGDHSGTSLFETVDRRFIGHVGHPEYSGERIAYEWERDQAARRTDVSPPANFDPGNPVTSWRGHRYALFGGMLRRAAARGASASVLPASAAS